jgi:hypothetical protein
MKSSIRQLRSLLLLFFTAAASAEPIQLACSGTQTEWDSVYGSTPSKSISKSFVIENRKIGNMSCTVWTEKTIFCTGGATMRKADGSIVGSTKINVEFDRLSGAVKQEIIQNTIVEIDAANPNPFGFDRTYKEDVNVENHTIFEGVCARASRRF